MGAEHPPDNTAEGDESADGLSQELSRTAKRAAIEDRQAKVAELLARLKDARPRGPP